MCLLVGLAVAVLSWRQQGSDPEEGVDPEAATGDVLVILDPGHFAVGSDLFHAVMTTVMGDLQNLVTNIVRLSLARQRILIAKRLVATNPTENRRLIRVRCDIGQNFPQHLVVTPTLKAAEKHAAKCASGRMLERHRLAGRGAPLIASPIVISQLMIHY
jgi:hypothetical protein